MCKFSMLCHFGNDLCVTDDVVQETIDVCCPVWKEGT